jgi:hypothetical protein
MCGLLKAARRPLGPDWERYGLDADGFHRLDRLVRKLNAHLHFEHRNRKELKSEIRAAVQRYRTLQGSSRPPAKTFAAETLDGLAQAAMTQLVYLGVEHLNLASERT